MRVPRLKAVCAAAAAAAFGVVAAGASAAGGGPTTCTGGTIAPGTYSSLVVAGQCAVDSGSVTVRHNVTVLRNASLLAAFDGSNLNVGGNVEVRTNGVLVLGCNPDSFPCFDNPSGVTAHSIGGSLIASKALALLLHSNSIGRNLTVNGGGGGVNCDSQPALQGSPAYFTMEDSSVGGSASVEGLQTCWAGFFRNQVGGDARWSRNVTADPDGNEIQTNTIGGNLNCTGNSPRPQQGDSGGNPNVVGGRANGQCVDLVS